VGAQVEGVSVSNGKNFADERKSGTIELLLTRPLSDLQIVLAKFFAAFSLVIFSLIPTYI